VEAVRLLGRVARGFFNGLAGTAFILIEVRILAVALLVEPVGLGGGSLTFLLLLWRFLHQLLVLADRADLHQPAVYFWLVTEQVDEFLEDAIVVGDIYMNCQKYFGLVANQAS
jgi:hypothetical protein